MNEKQHINDENWQEFESLAARIQQALAPKARVEKNARLLGKRSGVERQIDILIEESIGQYSIRIVIDCKDHKHPIDVKEVEDFMGLAQDVGANKGAIIAAKGFTAAAKKRAEDAGIDIYRLIDTATKKWSAYITFPCVIRDTLLGSCSFTFSGSGYIKIVQQDLRFMTLFRRDGTPIDTLFNLVAKRWSADLIPSAVGEHRGIAIADGETLIKTGDQLYPVVARANVKVVEKLFFGQCPIESTMGFADESSGDFLTSGFTTGVLNISEIEKKWERIDSIDQLSVKPILVLHFKSLWKSNS